MATTYTVPVRHLVWDSFVVPRPDWTIPSAGWDGWEAHYTADVEAGKRTTRVLPPWAAAVAAEMGDSDLLDACRDLFGGALWCDDSMWGGGLGAMAPGSALAPHLDGVLHPKRPGVRRAVQLICFVHQTWRPSWGGGFLLCDPDGAPVKYFAPEPGRLIAFDSASDLAYHGVERTAPDAVDRGTVSMSLLAPAEPTDTRRRALFFPARH